MDIDKRPKSINSNKKLIFRDDYMSSHNSQLSEAINKTIWAFNHGQYQQK